MHDSELKSPPAHLHEEAVRQREAELRKWQRDTFPQDPVLLYQLMVIDRSQLLVVDKSGDCGSSMSYYYAIPKDDMPNPDTATTLVFFDVIEQDSIVERAFVGCSIFITKVVFSTIEELLAAPNAPAVFDSERQAYRASKVMLGLLGIIKS